MCKAQEKEVTGANVLVAIFSEQESQAVYFLKQQDVARIDVVNYIAHGISKMPGNELEELGGELMEESTDSEAAGKDPLKNYATNLNEQARIGKIDPLVGRAEEVERVSQILTRRRKNNPLLVGEAGVGKTAVAEGLAKELWTERCLRCSPKRLCTLWILVRCWLEPNTVVILRSGSKSCSANLKSSITPFSSLMRFTLLLVPALHPVV